MPDGSRPEDEAQIVAVAELVVTGRDKIAVPDEMIVEPHPAAATPHFEKALWLQIREMSMPERIKLALRGNREARLLLLRDSNKMIQRLVLQNPRLSEEEILMLSKDRNSNEDILGLVADMRDWTKVYAVRCALVENARTPIAKALRLLATLDERELARLAKSKNVPNIISVQARRIVFQMRERR